MEVIKVANYTEEEVNQLKFSGKLLRTLKDGLDTKEFDTLSDDAKQIVSAFFEISKSILEK